MTSADNIVPPGSAIVEKIEEGVREAARHVAGVPVGDALIGRIVDPLGDALDGGPLDRHERASRPLEFSAPGVVDRQ